LPETPIPEPTPLDESDMTEHILDLRTGKVASLPYTGFTGYQLSMPGSALFTVLRLAGSDSNAHWVVNLKAIP
jgi:hypothetical protein